MKNSSPPISSGSSNNSGNNNSNSNNNASNTDNGRSQIIDPAVASDDDIISEGLLTSLTDTAISNLSQLAALQERCESQQQHSHQRQYQTTSAAAAATATSATTSPSSPIPTTSTKQQQCDINMAASTSSGASGGLILEPDGGGGGGLAIRHDIVDEDDVGPIQEFINPQDPFLSGAGVIVGSESQSVLTSVVAAHNHHQHQQHRANIPTSSGSNSPTTTTIHRADLLALSSSSSSGCLAGSGQSLASAVAAAAIAAAAAAANDQQQHYQPPPRHHQQQQHHHQYQQHFANQRQQQQQHHHHQQADSLTTSRSRLIASPASALPIPEFYHSLHQQQQHHAQNIHQHHQRQSPGSSTSLHYSQSTSMTSPSPTNLLIGQSRRSMTSAASSSSLISSIAASPNYLRRQFIPDRVPLMSPSPASGMVTGSSSGASSSLAHLLHQQRSASALGAASISSPSPTAWSPLSESSSSAAVSPLMNNKNSSQARLNNMQIRHKFGYLGSGRAQFNSPHGFCLGLNQEIVVADTNNHRVCIFDKSGTYITQFGSPGKEEGQLWNPRKVAILHRPIVAGTSVDASSSLLSSSSHQHYQRHHQQHLTSSHMSKGIYSSSQFGSGSGAVGSLNHYLNNDEPLYVVCDRGAERSRMQLFTKDGSFIKKIGIHYIDIVAGLAITPNGLIIVVDSVSPTVYIINGETGVLNGWFDCSGHMKEPSDIAVKSDAPGTEYFICDFKGHCVVVFSEHGEYLRRIGYDGLTSYPNGIDISDDGDILVGDSHGNRFHVVVFDRNGNFVSQFECPHVKVSRCCGLKITREGYIVTLAKNNHHVLVLDTIHI